MPSLHVENLMLSVPSIDLEHAALIAQANEFSAAVNAGASRAELEGRLGQLITGFQGHCESEEALMRGSNFPGLEPHIREHCKLIGQMVVLRDELGRGGIALCGALDNFVRLWTEQHILGPDAAFANFLLENSGSACSRVSTGSSAA